MHDIAAQSIALSLGVSTLVTAGCRRLRIPALLPLLLVGLALGTSGLGVVDGSSLGRALTAFITVAIGLLIFEGTLHLNREELRRAPRAVWGLLTYGTVLTWAGGAAAAHWLLGMSTPISVLLGATVIVTGPTVVQPILRLVRVTARVRTVLAAEAVLVDPIGVVATIATLEVLRLYLQIGPQPSLAGEGVLIFAKPLLGGAGLGLLMGVAGRFLLGAIGRSTKPEPQMVNLIAIGMCMTCVGLGETITPEGGLAAVTICGVIMARAQVLGATELRAFKELLAVMLVGTLFVLLASRFDISRLTSLTWRDGLFVVVLVFVVRPVSVFISTWRSKLELKERAFAATFAPRGIVALSVAAVASAELARLMRGPSPGSEPVGMPAMLADVERLDLVMFVVIAGTVLLASVVSPLLARLLGVRAGVGNAVLLVGGHPVSVALAHVLTEQGVHVRIVDNNEGRVNFAAASGIEAVLGDATDMRWMDDIGSPHDIGWLLAWTGNHDVDQIAARWADERLGRGHTAIWSSKRARAPLEAADISGGEPITERILRFEDGRLTMSVSPDMRSLQRVLGWVHQGRVTLNVPSSKVLSAPEDALFIGLTVPTAAPVEEEAGNSSKPEADSEPASEPESSS